MSDQEVFDGLHEANLEHDTFFVIIALRTLHDSNLSKGNFCKQVYSGAPRASLIEKQTADVRSMNVR